MILAEIAENLDITHETAVQEGKFDVCFLNVLETREADLEKERAMIETIVTMIEEGHEVLEETPAQDPPEKWIEEEGLIAAEMRDHTIEEMTIVKRTTVVTQKMDAEMAVPRNGAMRSQTGNTERVKVSKKEKLMDGTESAILSPPE